jgi:hypothetical protein
MKKLAFLVFVMILSSCDLAENLDSHDSKVSEDSPFLLKKLDNGNLLDTFIQNKESLFRGLRVESDVTFNNEEVFELIVKDDGSRVLVLNQDEFSEENSSNYGLIASVEGGKIGDFMFIQTRRLKDGRLSIDYFSKNLIRLSNVTLDPSKKSFEFGETNSDKINGKILCGEGVAGCIADAYTNHGWISVWAFVQTAFIPATAAGIAAGCAYVNCT